VEPLSTTPPSRVSTTKMATTTPTNGKEAQERPRRRPAPSAALLADQGTLPSQLKAVEEFRALEAKKRAAAMALAIEEPGIVTPTPPSSRATSPIESNTPAPSTSCSSGKKRACVEDNNDNGDDDEVVDTTRENACTNPNPTGTFVSKSNHCY
jgi:hypothetical protein